MRENSLVSMALAMSVVPYAASGESEEESESSKQNARSAFEITSVTTVSGENDDLEGSIRHPASADADSLSGVKAVLSVQKDSVPGESSESISEEPTEAGAVDEESTPPTAAIPFSVKPAMGDVLQQPLTQFPVAGGNGPVVQPGLSRFRKVNTYVRGRWTVRDTSEPEERPDSSDPRDSIQLQSLKPLTSSGSSSPIAPRKTEGEPSNLHQQQSQIATDLGLHGDSASERDANVDRSSTTVENQSLSRNTSLSSLVTTKSIDGDEHLRDLEHAVSALAVVSATTAAPGGTSIHEVTYVSAAQHSQRSPTVAIATIGHQPGCTCDSCVEV